MTLFKKTCLAALLASAFAPSLPATAQTVLFFEGEPSVTEIFEEIGLAERTRSWTSTPRALLNPQNGGRFDTPTAKRPRPAAPVAAAPQAIPEPVPELMGGKWIAALVQFEVNRADILGSQHKMLDVVGTALQQEPSLKVIVSGHADKSGGDAINRPLSAQRAAAVRAFLAKNYGVTADRMTIRAASADEPLDGLGAYDARNRRVQFGFVKG